MFTRLMLFAIIGITGCFSRQDCHFVRSLNLRRFVNNNNRLILKGDERSCMQACADGTHLTDCTTFTFADGNCQLMNAVDSQSYVFGFPDGSDLYEKVCHENENATRTNQNCISVFSKVPQRILVGYAHEVVIAPTLGDCMSKCVHSKQLWQFQCASFEYYHQMPDHENCILNIETQHTQPQVYTVERHDLVTYFEVDGEFCQKPKKTVLGDLVKTKIKFNQ